MLSGDWGTGRNGLNDSFDDGKIRSAIVKDACAAGALSCEATEESFSSTYLPSKEDAE